MDYLEVLRTGIASGNTWIPATAIKKACGTLSRIKDEVLKGNIIFHKALDENDINAFTFPKYHVAENEIAKHIVRLINSPIPTHEDNVIDVAIQKAESKLNIALHEEQKKGVIEAIKNPVMILTGGPGTGKTSVLQVIVEAILYLEPDTRFCFTAPTGKAARRITESTGHKAYTTNKKIQVWEGHMTPTPIEDAEVIICDEFSMSDVLISAAFFKAIPSGKRLILVGDVDQLPSVGAGSVLKDLINTGCIPVVKLIKTFRQAGDSYILLNSMKIKHGNYNLEKDAYFRIAESKNFKESADLMIKEYIYYVNKYGVENVACLVPYKSYGEASAVAMNKRLQAIINPPSPDKAELLYENCIFRQGDIVMQLKNKEKCVNGDVGRIESIKDDVIRVSYTEDTVEYEISELSQLTLAYAMTIHKSQGSEYKAIVSCFNLQHGKMLQRNLLYTAITRAKNEFFAASEDSAIKKAVMTVDSDTRFTYLVEKILYEMRKFSFLFAK